MNPVGLTNAEQTQETSAAPAVHPLAPAGTVSCRIVAPATGEACGAAATGRIVWPDRTRTPACIDCATTMSLKAQSAGTGIVGFEPIDRPWAVGTKNNPSQFSCYDKAEPDEPMFTLLARDEAAPALVRAWAAEHGEKPEKAAEARGIADAMEAWRREHRK